MRRRLALTINLFAVVVLGAATALSWPDRSDPADTGAPSSRQASAPANSIAGRTVFAAKGCAVCHAGPDSSPSIGSGPPLISVASRVPGLSDADYVRQSIREPQAVVAPGGDAAFAMPVLAISARELDALVAYLTATS